MDERVCLERPGRARVEGEEVTAMEFFEKNWSVIIANPLPFIAIAFLVGGFIWTISSIYFSGQIATAKGQAELAEKQRDDFKNKLSVSSPDEAKTKVDRLE